MTRAPGDRYGTRPPREATAQDRSDRVKLRRGLTFLGMTLVLPGSAQIAAGNKLVGRIALRVWAGLWAVVILLALLTLVWRGAAVSLVAAPITLRILQIVLIGVAVGWGLLLIDAWRIARPPELAREHRLGFAIVNLAVAMTVVGGLMASAAMVSSQSEFMASVFAGGGDGETKDGRINVLLLGGDAGKTRVGLRPDSLTVASIDAETGRTVLFSLPRNMEDVPFSVGSPLRTEYPDGYTCADHSCMLNAVYTLGMQNKDLYPGVKDPGAQATKEAVEGVTGLKINYYALVDLKGFEALIDAVGGIRLDINKRVPIGGGSTVVKNYIEPGKNVELDGFNALWFARSRHGSSDYERMARQKCVMNAMLKQLDPVTVLTKFNQIAGAGKEVMATDVPTGDLNTLLELALKAKEVPISSLAFTPPLVYPGNPKFDVVRAEVAAKIEAAEALDRGEKPAKKAKPKASKAPASEAPASKAPSTKTKKTPSASTTPKPGQETSDLGAVCSSR